jgi:hypothetical protein
MNAKKLLEKLQAKITLKLGRKLTQQELLDMCVKFAYNRLYEFISEEFESPKLTKKIIEQIRNDTIEAPLANPKKSDDELIYDL